MTGALARRAYTRGRAVAAALALLAALVLVSATISAHDRSSEIPEPLTEAEIEKTLAAAEQLAQTPQDSEEHALPVPGLDPSARVTRVVDWLIAVGGLDSRAGMVRFRDMLVELGYPGEENVYLVWREHMTRVLLAFDATRHRAAGVDLEGAEDELLAIPTTLRNSESEALADRYFYEMRLAGVPPEDREVAEPFAERIEALFAAAQSGGP